MADASTTREFTVYIYGEDGPPDVDGEDVRVILDEELPAAFEVEVQEVDIS